MEVPLDFCKDKRAGITKGLAVIAQVMLPDQGHRPLGTQRSD